MDLKISRILHAGYLLEAPSHRIAFDPVFENPFSTNCHAYPAVQFDMSQIKALKFDAVFISHFHDDHLSMLSLNWIDRSTPIFLFCEYSQFFDLIKDLGFTNVHKIPLKLPIRVGGFTVTAHKAVDEAVDSIFHIQFENLNILNVVDAWIHPETMPELKRFTWDMVLWPFQIMQEVEVLAPKMTELSTRQIPDEWKEQLCTLNPRILVPSSCQFIQEEWSWLRHAYFPISYQDFQSWSQEFLKNSSVTRIDPGQSYLLNNEEFKSTEPLPWIQILDQKPVDYSFNPKPESVQKISKHFPPLTSEQKNLVLDFCRRELAQELKNIGPSSDLYFNKTIIWKLALFEAEQVFENFYFKIEDEEITPVAEAEFNWITEICSYKFYKALFEAEPLTSLYLQINSFEFSEETQLLLKETDPLQDPLVRLLSNRPLEGFQRNQIKKIPGTFRPPGPAHRYPG